MLALPDSNASNPEFHWEQFGFDIGNAKLKLCEKLFSQHKISLLRSYSEENPNENITATINYGKIEKTHSKLLQKWYIDFHGERGAARYLGRFFHKLFSRNELCHSISINILDFWNVFNFVRVEKNY